MLNLIKFYLPVIICLFIANIRSVDSIKSNKISTFEVSGQFWNGEAVADFTCGADDNEIEIFNEDPKFLGSYLKTRIGLVRFRNCRFQEIQRKYGVEFIHLHTFNISGLELESLKNGTFKGVKKLTKLLASNNRLTEIPAHIFADAIGLESIDFSNNTIRNISALSFEGAISLTRLNLSKNSIDQQGLQFISIPSLTILDLSLNSIGNLSAKAFVRLPSLEHLNLRQANITSIEMKTFLHQWKLISLDLSENRLTRLNINLFHPSARSSLRSLSLNHNQLTELHCVLNSTLTEFNFLDLNNNNFNCTYLKQFMDFVQWERPSHRNVSQLNKINDGNVDGVTCTKTNDSSASKYNQFQAEFCPAIDGSGTKTASSWLSFLLTMFIVACVCILACASVAYRRYGYRFRIIPNNLNWMSSESTIQIVVD